jgi:hypothetical protein
MAYHNGHRYWIAVMAIVVVGIACAAVSLTIGRSATMPAAHDKPLDGLMIFAVSFVAALTIERLPECSRCPGNRTCRGDRNADQMGARADPEPITCASSSGTLAQFKLFSYNRFRR